MFVVFLWLTEIIILPIGNQFCSLIEEIRKLIVRKKNCRINFIKAICTLR